MTNEAQDKVQQHVERYGIEFPVAIVASAEEYPVKGYPTAFLVDAGGNIVWQGHPGLFDQQMGGRLPELLAAHD